MSLRIDSKAMSKFKKGQLITIEFEGREFRVIVIDLNGLGKDQPSLGFGFNMMENHAKLPQSTTTNWLTEGDPSTQDKSLKVPSGNTYKVTQITGEDGNEYSVLEVSEWVSLAADVIKKKGRIGQRVFTGLVDFLSWFAVKGFYADAYVSLKGAFTEADSRSVSAWMRARLDGITRRNRYTKFLQDQGCEEWYEYSNWTDYVYKGLFGMKKKQIVQAWELVEGDKNVGRNYVPEVKGLEAIAYCENQTIELHVDDLKQAHNDAINFTLRKFFDGSQPVFDVSSQEN